MERPADGEPSLTEMTKPETVPGGLVSPQTSPKRNAPAPQNNPPTYRQNHVGTAMLYGVRIVSLLIDEKERLCLAQISNTLLKDYSYNEIHNRRVALGITCVQCTPVQLEILRRAGAMPISSRRCGMITKREAERLVKSFLEDTSPPKLPENFAFDVKHACGWGGRGNFIPSRYNSSRAKCIKCCYCHMFFSPNKFIFHYHRTADSKYSHPDAANFNSWRRHLKLTDNNASDDLVHAWEDVKAMFNGGNRKRVFTGPSYSRPNGSDGAKKSKLEPQRIPGPPPPNATMAPMPSPQQPYHYPVFPIPNKLYPVKARAAHPAFPMPFPYDKPMMAESENISVKPPHSPNSTWNGGPDTMYPPYEMIWAKHLGLSSNESNYATSFPNAKVSPKQLSPYRLSPPPLKPSIESGSAMLRSHDCRDISPVGICREELRVKESHDLESAADHAMLSNRHEHFSAFRPVAGKVPADSLGSPGSHPQCYSTPESSHSPGSLTRLSTSPSASSPHGRDFIGSESSERQEPEEDGVVDEDSESDGENVDVDTVDEPEEENNNLEQQKSSTNEFQTGPKTPQDAEEDSKSQEEKETSDNHDEQPKETFEPRGETQEESEEQPTQENENQSHDNEPSHSEAAEVVDFPEESQDREENDDSGVAEDSDEKENIQGEPSDHLGSLSKDELQRELVTQLQTRRRLEEDCKVIKDTFQEQVKREQQYREEMAKQLQIVRETLCHELDQERKARFSLQQKLKEAHDALHNFSCKLLASRECSDCTYKEPVIPR